MIIERLGNFNSVLIAGVHFIIPWIDWPKKYQYRYYTESPIAGNPPELKDEIKTRISTQNEVLDFPRQHVITRDNAAVSLDAVLSYKIVNPKQMIYSVTNLPDVLSKLLQAQLRNVSGTLDIDQVIEEASSLNILTGLMDTEASRWGVKILFVKIQRVEAYALTDVLSKKKNADLQNKEIIINAKAKKQTMVIESEGTRDSMIKRAEGTAQEVLSQARGEAQSIINIVTAESRAIEEIARALRKTSKEPNDVVKYLLSIKHIDALKAITALKDTELQLLPTKSAFIQTVSDFGLNTIVPPSWPQADAKRENYPKSQKMK